MHMSLDSSQSSYVKFEYVVIVEEGARNWGGRASVVAVVG
jgi:hypothetical protein